MIWPGGFPLLPSRHLPQMPLVAFVRFTGGLGSFLCSKTPRPETLSQGSGLHTAPVAAANWGPCLRRNVISERERRCVQPQGGLCQNGRRSLCFNQFYPSGRTRIKNQIPK